MPRLLELKRTGCCMPPASPDFGPGTDWALGHIATAVGVEAVVVVDGVGSCRERRGPGKLSDAVGSLSPSCQV